MEIPEGKVTIPEPNKIKKTFGLQGILVIILFGLIWWAFGLAATIYLATHGQPWVGVGVLLATSLMRVHVEAS